MPQFDASSVHTAKVVMHNPTSIAFDYTAVLYLGINQNAEAEVNFHLDAGESKEVTLSITMPSTAGEYPVYVGVFSGGMFIEPLRQGENVSIVAPPTPAIAGTIYPGFIWHEPLTAWENAFSGREIPLNAEIHLAPLWINDSAVDIVGHVDLSVTYPDGSVGNLFATFNQDKVGTPTHGWYVQFQPFVSTQEGTYTLTATLSSVGQVLDSVTFTLVVVPSSPFTYTFSISGGSCPSATAFGTTHMSATIKNNHNIQISQNVKVMWARYSLTYGKWVSCAGQFTSSRENCLCDLGPCRVNPFTVNLAPGQQQVFDYIGYCTPEPGWTPCYPLIHKNYYYYFWLEDDAGGKSNEVVVAVQ